MVRFDGRLQDGNLIQAIHKSPTKMQRCQTSLRQIWYPSMVEGLSLVLAEKPARGDLMRAQHCLAPEEKRTSYRNIARRDVFFPLQQTHLGAPFELCCSYGFTPELHVHHSKGFQQAVQEHWRSARLIIKLNLTPQPDTRRLWAWCSGLRN